MNEQTRTLIAWLLLDNIIGELDSISLFEEAKLIQVPSDRADLPTMPIQNLVVQVESLRGAAQTPNQENIRQV